MAHYADGVQLPFRISTTIRQVSNKQTSLSTYKDQLTPGCHANQNVFHKKTSFTLLFHNMARNDFQILQKRDEIQYKLSSNMGHQHKLHPSEDVFF